MVIFPFSAVVANEKLKLALLLNAIDPKIGGVLIKGVRGSAKSTLARALAEVASIKPDKFTLLPLGADEERLIGSIDLDVVLREGKSSFRPGLLHQAHEGILYVDEVNLLSDSLVDLLLDVCASGVNTIERDGISTSHPACFVLIGTMNPDEGELRPQLLDRFGLCVTLDERLDVEQRMQVVQQRIAFDSNPEWFLKQYHDQQQQMIQSVQDAKRAISSVSIDKEYQRYACQICYQAQVEGVRADITLRRAAVAYAAWCGFNEVNQYCIDKVAEFVLSHRRQDNDSAESNSAHHYSKELNRSSDRTPSSNPGANNQTHSNDGDNRETETGQGDWGEMPAMQVNMGAQRNVDNLLPVAENGARVKKNEGSDLNS